MKKEDFRVVELSILGAFAQTAVMSMAVLSFWVVGAVLTTPVLIAVAISLRMDGRKPSAMSAIAQIPVVMFAHSTLVKESVSTGVFLILTLLVAYAAARVTHSVEPVISIESRLAWQILASTTVLFACLSIGNPVLRTPYAAIAILGFIIVWLWALSFQPKKI